MAKGHNTIHWMKYGIQYATEALIIFGQHQMKTANLVYSKSDKLGDLQLTQLMFLLSLILDQSSKYLIPTLQ